MNISIKAVNSVIPLRQGHKYLLLFHGVRPEEAEQILQIIRAAQVDCIGVGLFTGESVQIVEVPSESQGGDDGIREASTGVAALT
ncbi:MAG TPA: hypothetical protein VKT25_07915 [Ktedonobacteraceae bacterium]|nr:hypothetical protein [Ktedonobacteraceae bacterium]